MRKLGVIVAAAVAAIALTAGIAAAQANQTRVEIKTRALADDIGIQVFLQVNCDGANGTVTVRVTQTPPDSATTLIGNGFKVVACSGKPEDVFVDVVNTVFDAGNATAVATLNAPSGTDTDEAKIIIGR